tara:strand:- start:6826 stop:9165 length:2340 start_codon:yes stop_codon:yes gene_type:complete
MAEGDVTITGLSPNVPQWSTEQTLLKVTQILQKENLLTSQVIKSINALASGNAETVKEVRQNVQQARETAKATKELEKTTAQSVQEEKKSFNIFSNIYKGIERLVRVEELQNTLQEKRTKALEEKIFQATMKSAPDGDVQAARLDAKMKAATQATKNSETNILSGDINPNFFQKTIKGIAGMTVAAEGFNAYLGQNFEDRFNLANEIRQSGLFAGLDSASAGLIGFSETVNDSNFTLGQAAEFTERFSQAVGRTGVEAAMRFVNAMAYDRQLENGEKALGLMERFGMDFRQVSIVSGEYLESLRSANVLGKLSQAQMEAGMEDFMDGVTATSNVLKISLEDSAKMIADRLNRDDIAGFMALMSDDKKQQTTAALAGVGLEDGSVLGEAIIKRIAMGSEGFLVSDDRAQLMETAQGAEIVRLIEQVGLIADQGGDVSAAMKTFMSGAGQMVDANQGDATAKLLMATGQGNIGKMFTEIEKFSGTIGDIDKGITPLAEADVAQVAKDDIARTATVAIEGLVNTQMPVFAENLKGINTQTAGIINNLEQVGLNLAPAASVAARTAGIITEAGRGIGDAMLDALEFITSPLDNAVTGTVKVIGADDTKTGQIITDTQQTDEEKDKNIATKRQTKDITKGEESLREGGIVNMLIDGQAKNMFDELFEVLLKDKNADISGNVSELSDLMGFDSFFKDDAESIKESQAELMRAIEAIKEKDEFRAEGGQEKLQKLLDALEAMQSETYEKSMFRGDEATKARNDENATEKDALVGAIRDLIDSIKRQ